MKELDNTGLSLAGTKWWILIAFWGCWDFLLWKRVQRENKFSFHLSWTTVFGGETVVCVWVVPPTKQTMHWLLMILCLLHTHLSHLAHSLRIAPPQFLLCFLCPGNCAFICYPLYRNGKFLSFFFLGWTLQFPVWIETITDQTVHRGMCHAASSAWRVTGGHVTSH